MKTACNVEKQRLMNAIYQCGFAISDITLFLDTHPKDPDALDYFQPVSYTHLDVYKRQGINRRINADTIPSR